MNKSDQFLMCLKHEQIKLETALAIICGYLAWQDKDGYQTKLMVDSQKWNITIRLEQ